MHTPSIIEADQQQSAAALRASEERYRKLIETLPAAVFTCDADGRILLYNEACVVLWGRAPDPDEDRWNGAHALFSKNGTPIPRESSPMAVAVKEGRSVREEIIVQRKDGSRRNVLVHPEPLFDASGAVTGAYNVLVDITDRRLDEERLRVVTNTGKLGIWDWDIVADTITWTDPVYEVHGVVKGAFEPTMAGYAELIHPDDRERVTTAIKNALEQDAPYEIEFRALNADGVVNWVFTSAVVLRAEGRPVRMMGGTMNITRRKEAEEAARRLAAIVESSDDAIISKDLDGILTSWNKGAERMFGYTAGEIIGKPNTVLFPEGRQEEEKALFERLKQGERIEHYETVRLRKDGSPVDVSLTLSPLKNEHGEIIGASKTIRDITESKRAREAMRESEERFHLLADNVKQLIWMAEADGSTMWFNQRWFEFTGMTGEQIRMDAKSLHHPDHYDRVTNSLRERAAKGLPWEETFPLKGKDGEYHWFLATAMPVQNANGQVVRWFGTCTDITTAREAQALILENTERFRMLADNMSQMAYVADAGGRITWVNRRWTEYTGMGVEEMNDGGWGKAVDPAHFDDMVATCSIAQQKGEPWEYVFRVKSTTGEYRWFLSRSVPIHGEDGKVERWFGTNTDITDQKLAEEALEESAKHKDHFLATLAHELRNPLSPLKNGLQLMELAPDDPQVLETTREMMVRQLDHMVRLVDDLMDLSRISRGKIDLQKENMSLHNAVSMAMEASKPLIDRNGHQLEVIMQDANLVVHGDVARLTQVISNLLNNAAKYTPPGGRIELNVRKEDDQAVIRIKDNGVGIDPAAMPRVFDMFTQVDPNTSNTSPGGLGIGLNVVQRLVRMHNGDVEGRSEGHGKGSEFIVRLPLVATGQKPKEVAVVKDALASLSSRRVLVVDDNEDIALSMSMILKKFGHAVAVANDGEHAVAMAETFRPDVILMDIGMPKMNGYEACTTIRATDHGKRIHIIAVSGWGQEEDRKKSRDAGFDGHVVKPMEKATLERVIAEAKPHMGA